MKLFNLFNRKGSELEALQKDYDRLLKEAMSAQRNGDIKSYSEITSRAEAIGVRLDKLRAE